MQSSMTIKAAQPAVAFKASFDDKFLNAADAYYQKMNSPAKYKQFCSAVRRFAEVPNSDHITIRYNKGFANGKPSHMLYASENGKDVLLTAKDQFRKLLDKFSYMNEYEFKLKTGLIKKQ